MAILINDNYSLSANKPIDARYLNISTPWADCAEVIAGIPTYRYTGLTVNIAGEEYTIEQIFSLAEQRTIKTDEGEKIGASLEELVAKTGTSCSKCTYTITAKDGYQKTIEWDILRTKFDFK